VGRHANIFSQSGREIDGIVGKEWFSKFLKLEKLVKCSLLLKLELDPIVTH
jgi:hypothetical protein